MERWVGEERISNTIRKMRLLAKSDYSSAVRVGYTIYNSPDFQRTNDENRYIVCYNIALSYKKMQMYEESLHFLNIASIYIDENNQGYYRIQWLINECEIKLNTDVKKVIIERYLKCSNYYKSINATLMRAYVLYNMAKYKKNASHMFYILKIIAKEDIVGVPITISYSKRNDIQEILNDLKNVDYDLYEIANNYLTELEISNL